MLFSIITPCYNSEKTIERTILSVLNQSFSDYEYIIVDGASTDRTLEIVRSYEESFEGRLKVISEPDNGIYDAMNKGILNSKGSLVGIVNSDDYYDNDCLKKVSEHYESSCSLQVLYGFIRVVDQDLNEQSITFINRNSLEKGTMLAHPACFISKAIYDKYGLYNSNYKSAADYDYMLMINKKNDISFIPVYSVLSNFRIGGISQSYVGEQESNFIMYRYGFISYKKYLLIYLKNLIKSFI